MDDFTSRGTQSSLKPHLPCGIDIWTFSPLYYLCDPYPRGKSLTVGNLESLGRPGERSPLGDPTTKHLEGGPSSRADSWSCAVLQKHKKYKGKSPSTFKTHKGKIVVPLTKQKYPGQTPKGGHGTLK